MLSEDELARHIQSFTTRVRKFMALKTAMPWEIVKLLCILLEKYLVVQKFVNKKQIKFVNR